MSLVPDIREAGPDDTELINGLLDKHATALQLGDSITKLDVLKYYSTNGLFIAEHPKYTLLFAITGKAKGVDGAVSASHFDLHVLGQIRTKNTTILCYALLAIMQHVFTSKRGVETVLLQSSTSGLNHFLYRVDRYTGNNIILSEFVFVDRDDRLRYGCEWVVLRRLYDRMVTVFVSGATEEPAQDERWRVEDQTDTLWQRLHRLWAGAANAGRKLVSAIADRCTR